MCDVSEWLGLTDVSLRHLSIKPHWTASTWSYRRHTDAKCTGLNINKHAGPSLLSSWVGHRPKGNAAGKLPPPPLLSQLALKLIPESKSGPSDVNHGCYRSRPARRWRHDERRQLTCGWVCSRQYSIAARVTVTRPAHTAAPSSSQSEVSAHTHSTELRLRRVR